MLAKSWSATDKGRVREHNEDSCFADDDHGVYLVADGVGGAAAGEVASHMAVETVQAEMAGLRDMVRRFTSEGDGGPGRRGIFDAMQRVLETANARIYAKAEEQADLKGMATTASLLVLAPRAAFVAHVGDSRVYLVRGRQLHRITEDHTWAEQLVRQGTLRREDIPEFRHRHVIVRSVGGQPTVRPDLLYIDIQPGDVFLLCSDGLTDYASEDGILDTLNGWGAGGAAPRLVDLANQGGGGDNVTAVVVRVAPEEEAVVADEAPTRQLMHTHKLAFLRNRFFFQHLTHDELLKVLRYVYEEFVRPGDTIMKQGTEGRDIYFIAEGIVDVYVNDVRITTIGPGGHFGELSLVSGEDRSATIVAREPSRLLRMAVDDFYDLSQKDQAVAIKMLWAFLQTLGERVKQLSREIAAQR